MIAFLRAFITRTRPPGARELDRHLEPHTVTIARADRLLRLLDAYRRAEARRAQRESRHP